MTTLIPATLIAGHKLTDLTKLLQYDPDLRRYQFRNSKLPSAPEFLVVERSAYFKTEDFRSLPRAIPEVFLVEFCEGRLEDPGCDPISIKYEGHKSFLWRSQEFREIALEKLFQHELVSKIRKMQENSDNLSKEEHRKYMNYRLGLKILDKHHNIFSPGTINHCVANASIAPDKSEYFSFVAFIYPVAVF